MRQTFQPVSDRVMHLNAHWFHPHSFWMRHSIEQIWMNLMIRWNGQNWIRSHQNQNQTQNQSHRRRRFQWYLYHAVRDRHWCHVSHYRVNDLSCLPAPV